MARRIKYSDGYLVCGDNLEVMKSMPDDFVDLCFGSPPYADAREYRELKFNLTGDAWVTWMMERWKEMRRITKGVVAMVVEGVTDDGCWSGEPALLMAELIRAKYHIRKPPIYERSGTPGSGGPQWLRNCYEFVVCTSKGKLPWSDNTAMGQPPKFPPGGNLTNRTVSGERVNQEFKQPEKANPGNIIRCGASGGGHMGCKIAHEGDAPFPEYLAEFFIRSFCSPGGVVLDPFVGTGTTISVARQTRRKFVGIDIRDSEIEKSTRRLINASLRQGFDI